MRSEMILTREDIDIIFGAMREKYGPGWSDEPLVNRVQARLSLMLEMATKNEKLEKDGGE